jgi:hypothetical protein
MKTSHLARLEKIFEKLFKNLLTNTAKCGIIMSRGSPQDTIKGEQVHRVKNSFKNF